MGRIRTQLARSWRDALLNGVIAWGGLPRPIRNGALRKTGHRLADTANLSPRFFLGAWEGLTVGDRSFVNYGCFFDLAAPTTIGSDVQIGYGVMFVTGTHEVNPVTMPRAGAFIAAPIEIGDGCWIGARATILPGVTLPAGTIVAAGSVVTRSPDVPGTYAGVPARLVSQPATASS